MSYLLLSVTWMIWRILGATIIDIVEWKRLIGDTTRMFSFGLYGQIQYILILSLPLEIEL